MASVTLKNVYKIYDGNVAAVANLNLEIEDKEFLVLVGPSGCGKSTTLRLIAGLEEITRGEIYIGGSFSNEMAPKDRDIAMMLQNYALYPHMTVFDNMAYGLKLYKIPKEEIKRRVEETAQNLDLSDLLERKPGTLSSGECQRVALGRAVVRNPKVLLLDEPLSNMDPNLRAQMRTEIAKLHKKLGTTFIYVTQDQTDAMILGDRIAVMKNGLIQQVDTPTNLYDFPRNQFVAGFIGLPQMNFLSGTVQKSEQGYRFQFGDYEIPIPEKKNRDDVLKDYAGQEMTLGIRPEHIHSEPEFLEKASGSIIEADVQAKELTGTGTYLYLDCEGTNLAVRASSATSAESGGKIKIAFEADKIHLFHKDTEKAIIN